MQFTGEAARLTPGAFARAAAIIACDEAAIRAVVEVEASGAGFDKQRRPKILFEPHVFYRNLKGAVRKTAVAQGLAYAVWKPGAYGPSSEQYPKLRRAMAIDETAALKAASWGLPQILGENHRAAGFASVQDMVAAFCDGEDAHVEAMARFIAANKAMAAALTAHDWAGFAKRYNGPSYAKNGYDRKLSAAFAKHAGREPVALADDDRAKQVLFVQKRLKDLGYHEVGLPDGKWGSRTRGALLAFKADHDLPLSEEIDEATLRALAVADPRPVSDERATATADDVARFSSTVQASRKASFWGQLMGWLGLGGAGASVADSDSMGGLLSSLPEVQAKIAPLRDLFTSIPGWVWGVAVVVVAIGIVRAARAVERARVDQHRQGRTT